ncbi:MAG TPA: PSD1 and planctomycete cytochrome C domain-containing protein [Gemmatales bacterium]|nr:PSD1 and planctomycete cytochrome C domain-containing protein [Gemmatales bacterium]
MKYALPVIALCVVALASQPAASDEKQASARLQFNRDIRPILSEHCFACHGPDKNKRKGKFRLDERDSALSKKAIVPGKSAESPLIERIFSKDEAEMMPPTETHKPLSKSQKQLLKRWIDEGAEYQPHWAYIVPVRPAVPKVQNQAWVKTPIDAFILAQFEAKNIKPSPEADRATLLRRLSLDLIGLPPTWDEVQEAVKAPDDKWYEQAIDRLLASTHYGERMAVPWLDIVRYADTVGYHGDQNQRIFPYRDYVINAFNKNMPFDQFTREQIAGDLIPNATVDQRVASGFNRLNMMTREGGAQPAEYLVKYAADRVRTVAGTWLGSTVGCAECHDHKYDPFTSKDFYSLGAYFSDMKQWGVYQDYDYTPNPDLKGWSNDHPFPPEMEVESKYLKERMAKLLKRMEEVAEKLYLNDEAKHKYEGWKKLITTDPYSQYRPGYTPTVEVAFGDLPPPAKKKATKAPTKEKKSDPKPAEDNKEVPSEMANILSDGSIVISGPIKQAPIVTAKLPASWLSAIRIHLLANPSFPGPSSILRNNSSSITFKPAFFLRKQGDQKEVPIAIRFADADLKEPIYRNGYDVVGIKDGWRTSDRKQSHHSVWFLDQPIEVKEGDELIVKFPTNLLSHFMIMVTGNVPLTGSLSSRFPATSHLQHLRSTGWHPQAFAEIKELEKQYHECRNGKAMTQITEALPKPVITRVLPRGNFLDQSGEVVQPRPPKFLAEKFTGTSRLDLANWLTSADNPLTARVIMNRLWKQLFGNGLSNVLDDLGAQGECPSHPELLDWLAVEFRESGWDYKHMVKLMVMSNVYRQSAVTRTDLKEIDPNNRLLAAQNPRRLDAEFIRDQALFVAGLLNEELGGPSAFPYQPAGYYSLIQFPDRTYVANRDDRQYRRGLYTHWQRMFPHPMMANFDAPSREECTANRVVANTPQQALTLLNDPSFVEAARVLAEKLVEKPSDDGARLEQAFERVLSRKPKAAEKESLLKMLATQRKYYQEKPDEAEALLKVGYAVQHRTVTVPELAAWTNMVRVLLNLHETITKY